MKQKLQIRTINDIHGNTYDTYELMQLDKWGLWRSRCTFFSPEEAYSFVSEDIYVEDKRKEGN